MQRQLTHMLNAWRDIDGEVLVGGNLCLRRGYANVGLMKFSGKIS